jgi:mono/diheme cytochrome c family protein
MRSDPIRCGALALGLAALVLSLTTTPARGAASQDDLESERPGLAASFAAGGAPAPSARRVEFDLGDHWDRAAPDPRVPADAFTGRWEGLLLIQSPGTHRFFARTDGTVELKVAGRVVLAGKATEKTAESTPIELPAGLTPIVLEYRHDRGSAHVGIDWEGPGFGREPVPARLLFHDPAQAAGFDRFEEGRRLADRFGCAGCHKVLDMPAHPSLGPPLIDAGRSIDPAWLAAWLRAPSTLRPATRMPAFGHGFSAAEAADVAAFLADAGPRNAAPRPESLMALNVASPARGQLLFRSLGCLACHDRGDGKGKNKDNVRRNAPDLAGLARKRTPEWLTGFLGTERGARNAVKHRPDLRLRVDDAANLAAYLTAGPPAPDADPSRPPAGGDAGRGRELVERARCAACHAIPGIKPITPNLPLAFGSKADAGCLAAAPGGPLVPRFAFTEAEREALRAFVAALPRNPSPTSPRTRAEDSVRRWNCLGCHARDGRGGAELGQRLAALLAEDPALGALKGTLTPPNLTAVGDKLRPEYLAQAVRGVAPTARPWLAVRMPVFPYEPGEADAIAASFRVHDQMGTEPDAPEARRPDARAHSSEAAAQLIGQRGFGCVNCHVIAGRIPPGGEAETLGPDLALAPRRMTQRYFLRWIANPQRIIAGTPMPQFLKPVASAPGTLDDQLEQIWNLLSSPRLPELAAIGTREVLKRQGDRPLVVRDMVLLPDAPQTQYTPRGLALNLKNDHTLLFDTDRLTWLAWWRGGFLSRTKSGRLWEWHPEGQRLWIAPNRQPPVVLLRNDGSVVFPREVRERFGSFRELDFEGSGVALSYTLLGPGEAVLSVRERIEPTPYGWDRRVTVSNVPAGHVPALLEHPPQGRLSWDVGRSHVTLTPSATDREAPPQLEGDPTARLVTLQPDGRGAFSGHLRLSVTDP